MLEIFKLKIHPGRIYGLDILRCVAILFVVVEHGNYLLPARASHLINFICFDGVSIFFVLSGFLIGGILIRELNARSLSLKILPQFWQRRWFRTLPAYFLILAVLAALQTIFKHGVGWGNLAQYLTFRQNFASPHPWWFFPEAWSLSIEEWFYLFVPSAILLLAWGLRLPLSRSIVGVALATIGLVTLCRCYRYVTVPVTSLEDWDQLFRKQVVTRLDSLMFGVGAAYLAHYSKSGWLRHKHALFAAGTLLLLLNKFIPYSYAGLYACVFSFTTNAAGAALLLPYCSDLKSGRGAVFTGVTYISLISYSTYLVNFSLVQGWILPLLPSIGPGGAYLAVRYVLYWALTLSLSLVLYKYFELPTTHLRDAPTRAFNRLMGRPTPPARP